MWIVDITLIANWVKSLDKDSQTQIAAAIEILEEQGPSLKRPLGGKIDGSIINNMKELRPGSAGESEIRILFVFDPKRKAIMLVGGDKHGDKKNKWNSWYKKAIPEAEARYVHWLETQYGKESK